jgi:hypothetical protein
MCDDVNAPLVNAGIGLVIGINQTILGYPLDTLKTRAQCGMPLNFKHLYKGVGFQFGITMFNTSLCFMTFDTVYGKTQNSAIAGFTAGLLSGIVINPLEAAKVRRQTVATNHPITNACKRMFLDGYKYTIARECSAFTIYFTTYVKLKELMPEHTLLNGGIAGCASWALTYPLDTIKTCRQSHVPWRKEYVFRGFGVCMLRAFVVNAMNFYIYEFLHDVCYPAST